MNKDCNALFNNIKNMKAFVIQVYTEFETLSHEISLNSTVPGTNVIVK